MFLKPMEAHCMVWKTKKTLNIIKDMTFVENVLVTYPTPGELFIEWGTIQTKLA